MSYTTHFNHKDPQDLSSRIDAVFDKYDMDELWMTAGTLSEIRTALTALIRDEMLAARIDELASSFREFSKDVPFDERLAYYDSRNESLRTKVEQRFGGGK